jgi:ABC-type uncharacterized transport system fused permease/ATPase subunit
MQEVIQQVKDTAHLQNQTHFEVSDNISFENVSIYTPNANPKLLVKNLNITIEPGMHTLIMGPSGCGKTSILRVLCDLWKHDEGTIYKPSKEHLFYIPQQVYTNLGSLKEQIIYPDEDCFNHDKMYEALEKAKLVHLYHRVNDWNFSCNWAELLSPGERQRLALSRLFFRAPKFAILDESTSALDIDVEEEIYTNMKEMGITLISVGHRPTLKKFHDYKLHLDGQAGYKMEAMEKIE